MKKPLSRRDFLRFTGVTSLGMLLSACDLTTNENNYPSPTGTHPATASSSPTSTISSVPTSTASPYPTSTITPTREPQFPVKGISESAYPSRTLAIQVIENYAKAISVSPDKIALLAINIIDQRKKSYILACSIDTTQFSGTPLLIAYNDNSDNIFWQEATLKSLAELINLPIGTSVSFGDGDHSNPLYTQTLRKEFDFISLHGDIQESNWHFGGADYWTKLAKTNDLSVGFHSIFFSHDKFPQEISNGERNKVEKFIIARLRKILKYVHKNPNIIYILLANEPYFEYRGTIIWHGDTSKHPRKFPLYLAYRENWILETYILMYKIAREEFDLIPGEDFKVIGINLPEIELPGFATDYTTHQVNRIKSEASKRLNIQNIPFDIGMEFHLGDTFENRNATLPLGRINEEMITENLIEVSKVTGSKIFVTEFDGLQSDDVELANSYSKAIRAITKSGVVPALSLFHAMKFNNLETDWHQNDTFLPPDYQKRLLYYGIINGLYSSLPKK